MKNNQSAFALLLTLITVSIIASIGISVLTLSTKQIKISTNAKDSEIAFHAANAGVECGRYIRWIASSTMEVGGNISPAPSCFSGAAPYSNTRNSISSNSDGSITLYDYSFTWGATGSERCSKVSTLVLSAAVDGAGLSLSNVSNYISGYPRTVALDCRAGERCTVMSAKGFNKACGSTITQGFVEREVLLQF